jgi:O-antigen/teichoic acid export membrane protein
MIARLKKSAAARNFGWLVADKGVRLMVSVVVTGWVARYLGKQNYGLLNYSMALVAIFAAVTPLGMDALIVREIILNPKRGGTWIGTIMGFRGAAAVIASFLAFGLVFGLRNTDPLAWMLVFTLSIGTMFQSLESGELWFQAHTQMRRLVVPRLVLFLCMNVLKITAVLRGAGVVWFSVLTAMEQMVSGGISWVIVRRSLGKDNKLSFDSSYGWKVLRNSWPLAMSALSVVLYMKLSQLVLAGSWATPRWASTPPPSGFRRPQHSCRPFWPPPSCPRFSRARPRAWWPTARLLEGSSGSMPSWRFASAYRFPYARPTSSGSCSGRRLARRAPCSRSMSGRSSSFSWAWRGASIC